MYASINPRVEIIINTIFIIIIIAVKCNFQGNFPYHMGVDCNMSFQTQPLEKILK